MDNTFIKILLFGGFLVVTGGIYQKFYRPPELSPCPESGKTVEVAMRVLENQWIWDPAFVEVGCGDRVILTIFNEDVYDHGFSIDAFGVNKRLFPKRETTVEFVASKAGEFNFFCSVPCGEGHYRQTGFIRVTPETLEQGDSPSLPVEHQD